MRNYSNTQVISSCVIFIVINLLFCFKYLFKISLEAAVAGTIIYLAAILTLMYRYYRFKFKLSNTASVVLIAFYFLSIILSLFFISKETLNVDRWEIIDVFWKAVYNGNYPYCAQTIGGNFPGPMPFYYILCYPFHLLGEIGIITIITLIISLFYYSKSKESFSFISLLIISSPAITWEIVTRSTILMNSYLVFFYFLYIMKMDDRINLKYFLTAIAGGLLLSIRNSFALVFVIWGIYMLKQKKMSFLNLFQWTIILLTAFVFTFIPLIMIWPSEFFVMNPFIIQSSFLIPSYYIPFFFIMATILGFLCKRNEDVIYYSGLVLFFIITVHAAYQIIENGFSAYLGSIIDISYYMFCFPFLIDVVSKKSTMIRNQELSERFK